MLTPDPLVTHAELPRPPYSIPYSRKHLVTLRRAGLFPEPLQITANRVAWLQSDILAWIASRPRTGPRAKKGAPKPRATVVPLPARKRVGRPKKLSHVERARRAARMAKRTG